MIDVIIPMYNVEKSILNRCISSIATQTILSDLNVLLVDDASDVNYISDYNDIISNYNDIMTISMVRYDTNGGPGVARQYGIDHTSSDFITFIDADDVFSNALAIESMYKILVSNEKSVMASTSFNEVIYKDNDILLIPHNNDITWMFGKIYRRKFINDNNIRFHSTSRANEDNGFNTTIRLLVDNETNVILFNPNVTYYWMPNSSSITRNNNNEYSYGDGVRNSFHGYIENMIYAINQAWKDKSTMPRNILEFIVAVMVFLYKYYAENMARSPNTAYKNFLEVKKFYDELFVNINDPDLSKILVTEYNKVIRNMYSNGGPEFIIPISINQLFKSLHDYKLTDSDLEYYKSVGY